LNANLETLIALVSTSVDVKLPKAAKTLSKASREPQGTEISILAPADPEITYEVLRQAVLKVGSVKGFLTIASLLELFNAKTAKDVAKEDYPACLKACQDALLA
jgi:hypothetical protein